MLRRFREGKCTPEEQELLELWFEQRSGQSEWSWENETQRSETRKRIRAGLLSEIRKGDTSPASERPLWQIAWRVAASLLLVGAVSWYLLSGNTGTSEPTAFMNSAVTPGSNQAQLTLADGKSILLDGAANGVLAREGESQVVKAPNGLIEYKNADQVSGRNTLSVPKGATYQVTLPDGTRVWLNSSTQMTYFAGNQDPERIVELEGEAYFEVASDKKRPFKVRTAREEVRVTGTHFNVQAYPDDEKDAATLAEGQVVIYKEKASVTLKPGEQAVTESSAPILVRKVDVENVLAWKDGYFVFDDQDLKSIMKMASRWYNVEVRYQGNIPEQRFGGTFSKAKDVGGLISYLEQLSSIHFKQQGRVIMVSM